MESKLSRALAPKRPDAPTLTSRQLVKAWWQALRPPFFIVDLIPVGLGGALAARDLGYWPWGIFAVVMVGCFCLHTVANIANDLFDYLEGVDTDETIGGTKVIQNGWISPRQICLTIIGLLLSTVLIGWWLIGHSGQEWLWGPVVFAVLSAVFYVAPPIRYGCRGYGELFVCLNMGFIMVMGSYAVMANGFSAQSLALALPVGLMVAGILYYQSLPEIETDLADAGEYPRQGQGRAGLQALVARRLGSHGEPLGLRARRVAGVSRAADVPLVLAGLPPCPRGRGVA